VPWILKNRLISAECDEPLDAKAGGFVQANCSHARQKLPRGAGTLLASFAGDPSAGLTLQPVETWLMINKDFTITLFQTVLTNEDGRRHAI
jgi:hypothetical protein